MGGCRHLTFSRPPSSLYQIDSVCSDYRLACVPAIVCFIDGASSAGYFPNSLELSLSLSLSLDRPFSTVNDQGVTIDVWRQLRAYRSSLWSREARQLLSSFFIFSFILEFFPQFKNGEKRKCFPILTFPFRSISQAVAILIRQAKKSFCKARAAYGGTRLGRAVFRIRATKVL